MSAGAGRRFGRPQRARVQVPLEEFVDYLMSKLSTEGVPREWFVENATDCLRYVDAWTAGQSKRQLLQLVEGRYRGHVRGLRTAELKRKLEAKLEPEDIPADGGALRALVCRLDVVAPALRALNAVGQQAALPGPLPERLVAKVVRGTILGGVRGPPAERVSPFAVAHPEGVLIELEAGSDIASPAEARQLAVELLAAASSVESAAKGGG